MAVKCEVCGGTELIKTGSEFTCKDCGCKYSIEDVRKLAGSNTDDTLQTPSNQDTAQTDYFFTQAKEALDRGDNKQAEQYIDQCLAASKDNPRAWHIKGLAVSNTSTTNDDRFQEMLACFEKGVDCIEARLCGKGEPATADDIDCLEGFMLATLQSLKARIDLWGPSFAKVPGDTLGSDTFLNLLTQTVPAYLEKVQLLHTKIEQLAWTHEDAVRSILEQQMGEEEAHKTLDIFLKASNTEAIRRYAISQYSDSIPLATVKALSEEASKQTSLVGKYVRLHHASDICHNVNTVFDTALEMCNDPWVEKSFFEDKKDNQTAEEFMVEIAAKKGLVIESLKSFSDSADQIAPLVGRGADPFGALTWSMMALTAGAQKLLHNYRMRVAESSEELLKEMNEKLQETAKSEARKKAEAEWKQMSSYDEKKQLKAEERDCQAQIRSLKTDISWHEASIKELQGKKNSLGLFKSKEKRAVDEEIAAVRNKIADVQKELDKVKQSQATIEKRVKAIDNECESFLAKQIRLAQAKKLDIKHGLGVGEMRFDFYVVVPEDGFEKTAAAVQKVEGLSPARFAALVNDGKALVASDVLFNGYIKQHTEKLNELGVETVWEPLIDVQAPDGEDGYTVSLKSISNISGGGEDDKITKEENVAQTAAHYLPGIDIAKMAAIVKPRMVVAEGLKPEVALALAADLKTRGGIVEMVKTA